MEFDPAVERVCPAGFKACTIYGTGGIEVSTLTATGGGRSLSALTVVCAVRVRLGVVRVGSAAVGAEIPGQLVEGRVVFHCTYFRVDLPGGRAAFENTQAVSSGSWSCRRADVSIHREGDVHIGRPCEKAALHVSDVVHLPLLVVEIGRAHV